MTQFFSDSFAYALPAMWVFPRLIFIFAILLLATWGLVSLSQTVIIDSLRHDALSRSPINSLFTASLSSL